MRWGTGSKRRRGFAESWNRPRRTGATSGAPTIRITTSPQASAPARPRQTARVFCLQPFILLSLQHRLADDLFDGRQAVADFLQTAHAERHHAGLDRLVAQLEGAGAGEDHLLHLVVDLEHLVEADAPFVAGVAAAVAAAPLEQLEGARLLLREAGAHQAGAGQLH